MSQLSILDDLIVHGMDLVCHGADKADVQDSFPGLNVTAFNGGPLTPSRDDLPALAQEIDVTGEVVLVRDEDRVWGWDAYITALGLMGASSIRLVGQSGETIVTPPSRPDMDTARSMLLLVNGGIGNVVQTTPLLTAAHRHGLDIAFCPTFDSGGSLARLFEDTLPGMTLLTPDEVDDFRADIRINIESRQHIRPGDLFHSPFRVPVDSSEILAYLQFFFNATGIQAAPEDAFIGCRDTELADHLKGRIILAPGSKPHWDSKRWPHFSALAGQLDNPIILCRDSDVAAHADLDFLTPLHASNATVIADATLAEAAAMLHHARGVIANDCGLAHMAAAAGAPTIALFGPTSLEKNRPQCHNAASLSLCLDCQPCQGKENGPDYLLGAGRYGCSRNYRCMDQLTVDQVLAKANSFFTAKVGS